MPAGLLTTTCHRLEVELAMRATTLKTTPPTKHHHVVAALDFRVAPLGTSVLFECRRFLRCQIGSVCDSSLLINRWPIVANYRTFIYELLSWIRCQTRE